MGSQGLHLRASAHLVHQVHLKQPRAGDAPLAQVVMRLTLYLASGEEGQQKQNCSYGDVPNSQVRVMLEQ